VEGVLAELQARKAAAAAAAQAAPPESPLAKSGGLRAAEAPATAGAAKPEVAATVAAAPGTPAGEKPFYRKPWFWAAAVGGVVVVGGVIGLGVGLSKSNLGQPGSLGLVDWR
jgi:hypothetical protein